MVTTQYRENHNTQHTTHTLPFSQSLTIKQHVNFRHMSFSTITRSMSKSSAQQRQQHVPTDVLVEYMSPYLDRTTWNNLSLTSKEIRSALNTKLPPWPKQFRLKGVSPINPISDFEFCPPSEILMSPNREWLVYKISQEDGDYRFGVYHRRTGYLNISNIPNDIRNDLEEMNMKFFQTTPTSLS